MRADFDVEMEGEEARRGFIQRVARLAAAERLPPFTADAVAGLMEEAARSVGDRRKLPSQFDELGDLMREAAFWAAKAERAEVTRAEVRQAVEQRRSRCCAR